MTLTFRRAPFVPGGVLYRLYAGHGDPCAVRRARELFDHDPADPYGSAAGRVAAADEEYRGDRSALADALREENLRLGAGPAALAAIEKLRDPRALAVVTGQQTGLFTGPLYTLLKAVGATVFARRLEQNLGRPVVPVFWAATEDHDLAEADHAWLLDRAGAWRRVRYVPSQFRQGTSVGAVGLEAARVEAVLAELTATLPPGPVAGDAVALVAETGRASATLGEWSSRLIARLCGPLGLPVLDPMLPAVRRLAAPMVKDLLRQNAALGAGIARGAERVRSLGFEPQLESAPGEANLFHYPEGPSGPRRALVVDPQGRFALRGESRALGTAERIAQLVDADPTRWSGNVATRPLLQDAILPTLAYLAGPGEVAYYAMLGDCYRAVGRTMPLILPRPSVTMIRQAIARLLGKRGLDLPDLPDSVEAARRSVIEAADDIRIDDTFAAAAADVDTVYDRLVPPLTRYDAVLGSLAEQNRERVRREMEWLRRKAWQVARQRSAERLSQLDRIKSALWPRGGPQERTASGIEFVAELGLEFAAGLAGVDPGPPYCHYYAFVG